MKKENKKNETILLNDFKDNQISKISDINNIRQLEFLQEITEDSFAKYSFDNTFTVFNSINNILYLIYSDEDKSIITYNLIENKKINKIKNAHNKYITNFRYFLDKINKRDLVISISGDDNNIKLWNINIFECLLNIKNIYKKFYLNSACFLNDNNKIYIITSNGNFINSEYIKVFDFNGEEIKEINNSNDQTYFIDSFYDNNLSNNYIITGNNEGLKSYDFNKNDIYKIYYDKDDKGHFSLIVYNEEGIIKLIESSINSYIRIWNFHSGEMLKKIKVNKNWLYGICLWNNEYLIVGSNDRTIKLIELKTGKIIKDLIGHIDRVLCIKKINHYKYGECLISQGYERDQIYLWINKNN